MNSKGIGIALAVLAALVIATIAVYRPPPTETSSAAPTNPWAAVAKDRVDHVTIQRPSAPEAQRRLDFEKAGGAWRMTAPGQGPTEARAVEDLVDRFADMHVVSVAGRSASSYDTFEVDDAHATRVTLKSGANVLLDVFVGAAVDSGNAVRVPGKTEIFRVDQSVSSMVSRAPRDWRDREITRVARDSVRAVEWVNAHGTFRFTRNGDTWTAAPGTAVERLDTAKVNSLVDSVTSLRASDFAAQGANAGVGADAPRVTIETDGDGAPGRVVVRLGSNNGEQETFVQREGSDITYVISRTQAESVNPAVAAFQAALPVDGGTADASAPPPEPSAPPGGMPGMPPGMMMPGGPGGGQPQIPPEVLEQLRRQMQQQGAGGPPH